MSKKRKDTAEDEVLDGDDMIPPDHVLEAPFSGDEKTPTVGVCPDCIGEAAQLDDDVQPPALPSEAFKDLRCRGTRNWELWRICMTDRKDDPYGPGLLTLPSQEGMRVLMDRRRSRR